MKEPKIIVPKEILAQKLIHMGATKALTNVNHIKVVKHNVTKANWYHYLRIVDQTKIKKRVRYHFTHEKGIWKFYTIYTEYPEGTFVERWFWNEKDGTLEGECYSPTVLNADRILDAIFGF